MNRLKKFIVPINLIVYGENASDAITYVEEALDTSSFIHEDGIIGAEIMAEDVESLDKSEEDDVEKYKEHNR